MMSMLTPPRPAGWHPPNAQDRDQDQARPQGGAPSGPRSGRVQSPRPAVWPWVLLAAGAALSGLLVLLLAAGIVLRLSALGDGRDPLVAPESRVVLTEDFSTGSGSFEEYVEQGFTAQVVDGAYVMTSDDLQFTDWVTTVVVRADVIDFNAQVALAEDTEEAAEVGLTVEGPQGGYAFMVSRGSGASISVISPDAEMEVVSYGDSLDEVSGAVRLSVVQTSEGSTLVRGYLDGRQVAVYEDLARVGGFDEVGLAVYADTQAVTARFDDVVVRTGGTG